MPQHSPQPTAQPTPDRAMPNAPGTASPSVRQTRLWAIACLLALIALGVAWELWLAPLPGGTGLLALKVLPLALGLPGLLRLRLYTFRWLSLAVWLYVLEGLVRATSEHGPGALCAWAEVVLGVALFAACAMHVRARLKAGHDLNAVPAEPAHGG